MPNEYHQRGRSIDGTSKYIDQVKRRYPEQITIYRKRLGSIWDGKLEMVNAPLANIAEECLLWQIDSDELWTEHQVTAVHRAFSENPRYTAAKYWCWFFVGPETVITSRNCYGNNPQQEWRRTWRFRPGDYWTSHSPPVLARKLDGSVESTDIGEIASFTQDEMESLGAVFQHYAYVTSMQLAFKERYYGYAGALSQWKALQKHKTRGFLRDYLAWVHDAAEFDNAKTVGIDRIATKIAVLNWWRFPKYPQNFLR